MRPILKKALDLLARRSHFRSQLAAKLLSRGFEEEAVEAVLDRLTADGYLDDERTARELVAVRRSRGEGKRRLAAELVKRGAPERAIEAALAELPDDDLADARRVAEGWLRRRRRPHNAQPASEADVAALARHLGRKGFSSRSIYALVDELREGALAAGASAEASDL